MRLLPIQTKTNRVLHFVLLIFLVILFRVWYLSVIEREEKIAECQVPRKKTVIQRANRGPVFDRFGVPLATNQISYNASIYYAEILQIPRISWKLSSEGKKGKVYERKRHIEQLAELLGKELAMDPKDIEDQIYAKASLFPHTPYVIKENITEKQYYRLRMLERDWLGLHGEISAERFYPLGKLASHVIGYMGAINPKEYLSLAQEMKRLENFLQLDDPLATLDGFSSYEEVQARFLELKEKAYTMHDLIGKMGIEQKWEKHLRGQYGKKTFEVNVRGSFLKELPGTKEPTAGKALTLSISSELQKFAEALLCLNEEEREGKSVGFDPNMKKHVPLKQPWIKGGAIVALDPKSGEVLALASHPRFDPNDFIFSGEEKKQKMSRVRQWLETHSLLGAIWDGKQPLKKEGYLKTKDLFFEQKLPLTWDTYLSFTLPKTSEVLTALDKIQNIRNAILLQEDVETLLYYAGDSATPEALFSSLFSENNPSSSEPFYHNLLLHYDEMQRLSSRLSFFLGDIPSVKEKLFAVDLCRLAVHSPSFSDALIAAIGDWSLSFYFQITKAICQIDEALQKQAQALFHTTHFSSWREENEQAFLKEKREEEKRKKSYARPYTDYLRAKEQELFTHYWKEVRTHYFLLLLRKGDLPPSLHSLETLRSDPSHPLHSCFTLLQNSFASLQEEQVKDLLRSARSYSQLDRPLLTTYPRIRKKEGQQTEKELASAFYPLYGYGFARSYGFRQATPMGSIFKLLTAYEALKKRYVELEEEPHSLTALNPLTIYDEYHWDRKVGKYGGSVVGYSLEGKPYPRIYKGGRLPRSSHTNLGKVDLFTAIERSSNPYFSLLAGDYLSDPEDLKQAAFLWGLGQKTEIDLPGEIAGHLPQDLYANRTGLYSFAIGQHSLVTTPLQTALFLSALANKGHILKPKIVKKIDDELLPIEVQRTLFLPEKVREFLFEAMDRVISGEKGSARPSVIKSFYGNPSEKKEYEALFHHFIGKTSTAEILSNPNANPSSQAKTYKHISFGGISFAPPYSTPFKKEIWEYPDLVIVVYLPYGSGGKEAAPLAAKMVVKWREIEKAFTQQSSNANSLQ